MTIDERLDRLTERHEALTQYLELTSHEWNQRFAELAKATIDQKTLTAEHGRQIGELGRIVLQSASAIGELGGIVRQSASSIGELGGIVRQSASSIDTLGRIAEMHEHRLDNLEGA